MREISLFQLIPSLGRRALRFIKDEYGGKAMHPKLPIEVQLIWSVIVTLIGHQSKSRNKIWVLNHLIWLASIGNQGQECEFGSLDSISFGPYDPLTKKMNPTDYDMVVNVEAYSLVYTKHLGCYLDTGTWWAFLQYLFREIVVEIDES
jgi:hypothetical protein